MGKVCRKVKKTSDFLFLNQHLLQRFVTFESFFKQQPFHKIFKRSFKAHRSFNIKCQLNVHLTAQSKAQSKIQKLN